MNGLMQWFKSSNKMKRWIFLILLGIILSCYGLAKVIVMKEISFKEVGEVVAIFVLGFVAIVLGLIFLNKRTLEILVESTDDRMQNRSNVNVNSLIFNKTVYDKGPNIVVIGGGTGLNTVLAGLKNYTNNLTAIVTISDYGEEEKYSRKELQTLPLNDVKDSIISLAPEQEQIKKLFNFQFNNGKLAGLNFSDIYFSAMKQINGNFEDSIIKSNEVLNIVGKVIPVTLDEMKIVAELANGYLVEEKSKIPEIVSDKITSINRIMIKPANCRPAPGVLEAIKNADCIIIGPGSLYTNVIPNLLVNGVAKAVKESSAIKVYISNIMTEPGQTDNYSVADHLKAIVEHCGEGIVDYCIYDTGEIVPEYIKKYNLEGQDLVVQESEKVSGVKFLQRDLSAIIDGHIRHNPSLVASSIIELICDDLKYQDKQNDPQFLMLNNKLRQEKKINKIKKNMDKRVKKGKGKREKEWKTKSKFSSKYSERIASIREADGNIKNRRRRKNASNKNNKVLQTKSEKIVSKSNKSSKNTKQREKHAKNSRGTREKHAADVKKSKQEIREEMIKKLENSKLV